MKNILQKYYSVFGNCTQLKSNYGLKNNIK